MKNLHFPTSGISESHFTRGTSSPPASTQLGTPKSQSDELGLPPAIPFTSYNVSSRSEEHNVLGIYAASTGEFFPVGAILPASFTNKCKEAVAYPPHFEPHSGWQRRSLQTLPPHYPAILESPQGYVSTGYWKPFEPPSQSIPQTYPRPFSSLPHTPLHHEVYTPYSTSRIAAGWHEPPMRSASYENIDTVHRSFPPHSSSMPQDISRRASTFSLAPPMMTSEHSTPTLSEAASGTISAPPFRHGSQGIGGYSTHHQATWSPHGTHLPERYSTADTDPADAHAYDEQWYPR